MKIIETDRLIIRHMSTDDAGFMLELLNEPAWLRFIGDRGVRTIEDAHRFILDGPVAMYARLGHGFYVVQLKQTGCQMGICGLVKRDFLDDVDIGYAFLTRYRGQAYAYEAGTAVLEYAKGELGLQRVVAALRADNHVSAGLLEKLGLRFEGMVKHPDEEELLELFSVNFAPSNGR